MHLKTAPEYETNDAKFHTNKQNKDQKVQTLATWKNYMLVKSLY